MEKDPADKALEILRIICRHRRENAVKGEQIQDLTGTSTREVAEIAGRLARHGFMVCSGAHGYFMAATPDEWREHLEKEERRAIAVLDRISESKKNTVNQPTLFEINTAA